MLLEPQAKGPHFSLCLKKRTNGKFSKDVSVHAQMNLVFTGKALFNNKFTTFQVSVGFSNWVKAGWLAICPFLVTLWSDDWMAWSVKHKKKRELQISLPLKKGPHTLHSVKYKSLQERKWKLIHYFWLLRPNCQLEYCIKREKTEYDICFASGQNLPWFNFIFPLPGNCKDY